MLRSEALFQAPQATLQQIATFLGVSSDWAWGELNPFNVSLQPPPPLPEELSQRLRALLEKHSAWALGQVEGPRGSDGG